MTPAALRMVLEATGFLEDGQPAPTVLLDDDARRTRRGRQFAPDALWRGPSSLTVYFKYSHDEPSLPEVSVWRREIWNEGFAPLLWVVCPSRIDLYNGFGRPTSDADADEHRLRTFQTIEADLRALDTLAGRLAMETGQFWLNEINVDRKTSVDAALLGDLAALERGLVRDGLNRSAAQALIGRTIFTQYLVDRRIVDEKRLQEQCGMATLPTALRDVAAARALFQWLTETFNGDMFPASAAWTEIGEAHLARVADFLEAVSSDGQRSLFPYQFDVIPVELISSIYEQFAHSASATSETPALNARVREDARRLGVHYTRLSVVSLILDEVMTDLIGSETVLDLTCGSGVFLVESLRRLVMIRGGPHPTREVIRQTLHEQVFGVDISEAAIRVAAFSLYLAALELDPDPQPPEALRFQPLIERTLFVGDARDIESSPSGALLRSEDNERRRFDILVGNPPWTFKGKQGTAERRVSSAGQPRQPRGQGLDFVLRAHEFAHERSRFGFVLPAPAFFAGSKTGRAAVFHLVKVLSPATFIDVSSLTWLFPTATMPAAILLARSRPQSPDHLTVVKVPWAPSGARSETFEISSSDVSSLALHLWEKNPTRLKTAVFGRRRDMVLADELESKYRPMKTWLASVNSKWRDGLQRGSDMDATGLRGLEILETGKLTPFRIPHELPSFSDARAHRPRRRDTYRSPLVVLQEGFRGNPRPVVAVAEQGRDLIYTEAYFGASLSTQSDDVAHLLAGILSSALASWFFLMTATEFGIWKRRLHRSDLGSLPLPDPSIALRTGAGQKILAYARTFSRVDPVDDTWRALDEAVFDLYELDEFDRVVVNDGMEKASWQWDSGRQQASLPAHPESDLQPYATAFVATIDSWLQAMNLRRMRAEVFALPTSAPLRVVRFVLESGPGPSTVEIVNPAGELSALLSSISQRLNVRLATSLVGQRELRVHGVDEVVVIKPAARRFWLRGAALEDADAVIAESFSGATA